MGIDWPMIVSRESVAARPKGLWTLVHDFVRGPGGLWITASGQWFYAADRSCGPDGDLNSLIARAHCIFPKGPVGALIGKIGGSSAGLEDGTLFLVGSNCALDVSSAAGPLYFTINDEYTGMINNRDHVGDPLLVTVRFRVVEEASTTPPAGPAKTGS